MEKRNLAIGIGGAVGGTIGAAIALKLLTRASTVNFEDYADSIPHAANSEFVEIDGKQIHYQEFGDHHNPKLILIHGYTASTYVWKMVAPMFAERGFHVIAVDLVGYGYSEKPDWFDYKIDSQARMISRFMNRLGIGKATLVGSSYGGAVVAWFALDYPERVEKLVLIGSVINNKPMYSPLFRALSVPGIGETISPFLIDSKVFAKRRMQNTIHKSSHDLISDDRVDAILRPLKAADSHRAVLETARNWDADRIENDAHLIDHQTLLIWGENDVVIPKGNGEKLYDRILNSRLVVLKDCGHLPPEEKPDILTDLIVEFCNDKKGRIERTAGEDMVLEQIESGPTV